ncbi:LysR family transcriptional regulator [Frigidibacter sp. ROC022]|uniref:LysR family transcriptional regulator n=1 Tax=Frigidibacter sp. ROC022 TaxID=2971796 RepID=UPI00215B0897|nr:LysR family transcriptional regulator [Frigidibacter sp. ROC022]MCR8724835.1 LysR family transcriptional regulator [Frigidibacter sp. ROC022]
MDKRFDWSLAQSFLAVAETGSLSAAARRLGLSQPTLGRQIRALETALRSDLFRRVPKGLEPTEAGLALIAPARAMAEAAARLSLAAAGQDSGLAGTVRITASVVVSHFLLPPVIAGLRRDAPEIQIDLVASDSTENLLFREADIALRMHAPQQEDLIARRLPDLALGLCAARSFLDRVGRPADFDEALQIGLIGFDRSELMLRSMRAMGVAATRDSFPLRTDDQPLGWHLIRAGCGIGVAQLRLIEAEPEVERLLPDLPLPGLPLWIVAPQALRTTARIRRVWDALVAAFDRPPA